MAVAILAGVLQAGPARAAEAGDLDHTFGGSGGVASDLGGHESAHGIAVQTDNKVVVAGFRGAGPGDQTGDFAVVRYDTDGAMDDDFGTDGQVLVSVGDIAGFDVATDVAIQPDGKIVVVGRTREAGSDAFGIVRLNADGSLDKSFNEDGIAIVSFVDLTKDANANAGANGIAIDAAGRIVVVGYVEHPGTKGGPDRDFAIVRLEQDGDPDPTFNGGGLNTFQFDAAPAERNVEAAEDVAIQEDGKIVLVGSYDPPDAPSEILVTRFINSGTVDPAFNAWRITFAQGGDDFGMAVDIDDQGRILVGGTGDFGEDGGLEFTVARLMENGQFDPSFGNAGGAAAGFYDDDVKRDDVASDLVIQEDGKIVVVGSSRAPGSSSDVFAVVRFDSAGVLDTSFSADVDGGETYPISGASTARAFDVALDMDGKIVVTGEALFKDSGRDFATIRIYSQSVEPLRTTTVLSVTKRPQNIRASGSVSPAPLAGGRVKVTLSRRKNQNSPWKRIDSGRPTVAANGRYSQALDRPNSGGCKVVAKFAGDQLREPSKASKTFAC